MMQRIDTKQGTVWHQNGTPPVTRHTIAVLEWETWLRKREKPAPKPLEPPA